MVVVQNARDPSVTQGTVMWKVVRGKIAEPKTTLNDNMFSTKNDSDKEGVTDLSISEQQFAVQQTLQELGKLFIIKVCVSLQLLARKAVNLKGNKGII